MTFSTVGASLCSLFVMLTVWNFNEFRPKSDRLQRHVRGFTYTLTLPTVQELIYSESPPPTPYSSYIKIEYQNLDTLRTFQNLTIPPLALQIHLVPSFHRLGVYCSIQGWPQCGLLNLALRQYSFFFVLVCILHYYK